MTGKELGQQPAKPVLVKDGYDGPGVWLKGLTKREEFAKAAMAGLLANPNLANVHGRDIAADALRYADLMLDALAREDA